MFCLVANTINFPASDNERFALGFIYCFPFSSLYPITLHPVFIEFEVRLGTYFGKPMEIALRLPLPHWD